MRTANRIASCLLGLALLAAGLLLTIETLAVWFRRGSWLLPLDDWHHLLTTVTIDSPWVLGVSVLVSLVGLTVVIAELVPWPPEQVRLDVARDAETRWRVTRKTVEQGVVRAAEAVSGVTAASARVRGREQQWRVHVAAQGEPDRRDDVGAAVRRDLDRLGAGSDVPLEVAMGNPRRVA